MDMTVALEIMKFKDAGPKDGDTLIIVCPRKQVALDYYKGCCELLDEIGFKYIRYDGLWTVQFSKNKIVFWDYHDIKFGGRRLDKILDDSSVSWRDHDRFIVRVRRKYNRKAFRVY